MLARAPRMKLLTYIPDRRENTEALSDSETRHGQARPGTDPAMCPGSVPRQITGSSPVTTRRPHESRLSGTGMMLQRPPPRRCRSESHSPRSVSLVPPNGGFPLAATASTVVRDTTESGFAPQTVAGFGSPLDERQVRTANIRWACRKANPTEVHQASEIECDSRRQTPRLYRPNAAPAGFPRGVSPPGSGRDTPRCHA
jgi:hypothetical protein